MSSVRFALNHMCAPSLGLEAFFVAAKQLGVDSVEIRNDLAGNAILDGTPATAVKELAARHGLAIISINALQRFNEWTEERAREAAELIGYARNCGARALVLVPVNDGSGRQPEARRANLRKALSALKPMLEAAGIVGLVEPLGFEICSLRLKSEAAEAIEELGAKSTFCLVHDTFHHHLAGEAAIFPDLTGLVHISGVDDPTVSVADMRDSHRVLVDANDRLDNVGQLRALLSAGYAGPASFEPFAPTVHALTEPVAAIKESMAYVTGQL